MSNADVYQAITMRILEALDKGVVPWRKPWATHAPRNMASGHVYRGVNQLLLSCSTFVSPFWLTLKQANDLGGRIKRGERGTPIVFWKVIERPNPKDDDRFFLLKRFTVFNAEQTEGITIPTVKARTFDPIAECEAVVASYKDAPTVAHGGNRACYIPSEDRVQLPSRESFVSPEECYSTLFHELVHSTGAERRLARKGVVDSTRFASHTYSEEELVAECGAAFLCAHAGVASQVIDNSAAYIAHWSRALKSEPRWMVDAASKAARAADLILGKLPMDSREPSQQAA